VAAGCCARALAAPSVNRIVTSTVRPHLNRIRRLPSANQFPQCATLERTDCVQTLPGVKSGRMSAGNGFSGAHGDRRQRGSPGGSACSCAVRKHDTRDCILGLDTTRDSPQNPCNFSTSFLVQGARVEKRAHRSRGCWLYFALNTGLGRAWSRRIKGGETCSICPVGPVQCINPECLARGHWLRAGRLRRRAFAATAMRRSTMFRRR